MSLPSNIDFLTLEDIYQIHEDQIARYGGKAGIRDEAALESALAQPETSFEGQYLHDTLFDMASAYVYHISQNQPFNEGNKRTGLVAGLSFLELNGYEVLDPKMKLPDAIEAFPGGNSGNKKKKFGLLLESLSKAVFDDRA